MQIKNNGIINNIAFYIFLVTIIVSPFFFIPNLVLNLEISKGLILFGGLTLSFLFWLVDRLIIGKIDFPKSPIFLGGILLPVVFLVTSLFSSKIGLSLFGNAFEIDTFFTISILSLGLILGSLLFENKERIMIFFYGLLSSFGIVVLLQFLVPILNANNIKSPFLNQIPFGNTLVSWSDLSIFCGLIIIVSMTMIELSGLKKIFKIFLSILSLVAILIMMIVGFMPSFFVLGLLSVFVFIYLFSIKNSKSSSSKKVFPIFSLIIIIISLIEVLSGNFLGNKLASILGFVNNEIRLSVGVTFEILKNTFSNNPIVGYGTNLFSEAWLLYKPVLINNSLFWDSVFVYGFGLIPTFIITGGLLSGITWLGFLGAIVFKGFKAVFKITEDRILNFSIFASFVTSLYLWIFSVIHTPSLVLFSFAFVMTGIFVTSLVLQKNIKMISYNFLKDPRLSFFSILIIFAFMLLTIWGGVIVVKKFSSLVLYSTVNTSKIDNQKLFLDNAELKLLKAINLNPKNDLFYRALSEIYLSKINFLINENKNSIEPIKIEIQNLVLRAEDANKVAVQLNKENQLNWFSLARFYENTISLGVEKAYEKSKDAYSQSLNLNPKNPSIRFALANLELSQKNIKEAKVYLEEAIDLKQNYSEAYILLSQIALSENQKEVALGLAEKAVSVDLRNIDSYLNLGNIYYQIGDYENAISLSQKLLISVPENINLHYLLGISYLKVGNTEDAKRELDYVASKNPNGLDIESLLNNSGLKKEDSDKTTE